MMEINYKKIEELFNKYNYVATEDLIWRTYIGLMQSVGRKRVGQEVYAICLNGPAGAGKSSYAKTYYQILKEVTGDDIEFLTYSCNTKTGKEEIFEDIKLSAAVTQDAEKLITPGFIASAISLCNQGKKVLLRVDEYDKAKPETDSYLLEFLQEGRISTSQSGELKLNNPENLQVILCKNDFRAQLSGPLTRRLNFINLEYTTPDAMSKIIGMTMKKQSNAIKILIAMMYSNIYKDKDDYTRIPSVSEVMIAIDEADLLTKGGASKKYVYRSIINNLFKTPVDIATFMSGNKKNGELDEDIETLKDIFNDDADSSFDRESLMLDLYTTYFKPLVEELREEMQLSLDEICFETNEFKSSTDYKLVPIEVGEKQQSKFYLSSSWFMIGNIKTNKDEASILAQRADDKKYDGPVFMIDDYLLTVVKEEISSDEVNLNFLSNKPAIPTGVLIKLKELIQYMQCSDFNFSFPLISQYKFDKYIEKQNGFYQYETSIKDRSLNEIFDNITEIKLLEIKMKNGRIIEGKHVSIEDFGRGNRAVLKVSSPNKYSSRNINLEVLNNDTIDEIEKLIDIPLEKPILVSSGRSEVVSYDSNTKLSKLRIKSKKKGSIEVDAFDVSKVVEDLNAKNYDEAEALNESLLSEYEMQKKNHILENLDYDQKRYLTNFIEEDKLNALNVNEAVSNCIAHDMEQAALEQFTIYKEPRSIYDCLSPDIKTFTLRLNRFNKNHSNN